MGIEMIMGVKNAIPGRPYFLFIRTKFLDFFVNIFFLLFSLGGKNRYLKASQTAKSQSLKNIKTVTPNEPEVTENSKSSQKFKWKVLNAEGTPITNLTELIRKIIKNCIIVVMNSK